MKQKIMLLPTNGTNGYNKHWKTNMFKKKWDTHSEHLKLVDTFLGEVDGQFVFEKFVATYFIWKPILNKVKFRVDKMWSVERTINILQLSQR